MNVNDFLLLLIGASGGSVSGRTLLQKRSYFVALLIGVDPIELGFSAHYYGPYSAVVDSSLSRLKSLGFVDEANIGFGVARGGFEVKRYDYRVTDDGKKILATLSAVKADLNRKIRDALERIQSAGDPNYFELSIAAKAYFILRKIQKRASTADVIKEAEKFEWNIQPESLSRAVDFLVSLGLVEAARPAE